ncbi:MAG TPA: bifunctional UDP-N-acetylmuramoyl-tripeptide:D-alanyl-D-alanine ligase/alanine racemase [Niabella sp.]|nr:bifunctional UDP-N-acetylmuramoyl-tripeptide:D-alanyl-D-alanine ligase/alanine racemase [Niabella sp.]HOZ95574.1 bifunctional UDP-N-acetylmuramoyl-tripeptide:D-alanyl-D-alanine ligase/alanine racemase [Niabella sp.]HQW13814.1 bifunctional UDP-N-acetylmuramoyl-tripeptide:D-alanyl-D-alanine ligase/alanine racemase [Niabella sp.]HQX19293.1 bifunctional UDP-N-acetylmuramoyl-tripeptide:D-alanyl-D-alanine ligase/alanine racemase [Niabella sp.]HQX41645.1 bifunctional UDP-N-acetylmuramoyl-tripeptide
MYTLKDIAAVLHCTGHRFPSILISHLLTDSRKLTNPENSLFFALNGPRRDGHFFIPELYKAGLRYFVVTENQPTKKYPGAFFLKVGHVLKALQSLVAWHRSHSEITTIGITGSNGKTIVKEWLYQMLQPDYNIVRSPKSYNSQIGVPLSVWQIAPHNNLAIFEAGISQPNEMARLASIIQPTIGVLTNIGTAHSEGFKNDEEKLKEKLQLFQNAKIVIANGDNRLIRKKIESLKLPALFWGKDISNQIRITEIKKDHSSTAIRFSFNHEFHKIIIPFTDEASVENAISCYAVLLFLHISPDSISSRMMLLQPVNMRLEFKKGINNCIIINDSYSADTDSLNIALDFLKQQSKGLKKTVILSDFLQSGGKEIDLYANILEQLQKHKISRFIGIGKQMQTIVSNLVRDRKYKFDSNFYLDTKDFLTHVHSYDFREEAILIKGARVFAFETIASQLEQKLHQTILEINLDAITHNFKTFQQMLKPSTKIMVMVKAFAYGSGGTEIAGLLQYHKVDYLGVAYADEGVELRKAGITVPIMVLNPEVNAFDAITDNFLEPDIFSFNQLVAFQNHVIKNGLKQYPIHIEFETGMNRLGFEVQATEQLGILLKNNEYLKIQSVFSHLAASEDSVEDAFTLHQHKLLTQASKDLQKITGAAFIKHISNSSAIIRFPKLQMDMVRLGIGLYGIAGTSVHNNLWPALTLKSNVAQIKKISKGETVSYNRRGIAQKDSVIATVRIGYADGYSRRLGNGVGYMVVQNKKAPVIGTVCMDMVMIDVSEIPNVKEGDEVIVFGPELPVEELATRIGTIPYELMTAISQRVKRVYWSE